MQSCQHTALVAAAHSTYDRYLGVTPPISTAESNQREKEVTTTLMEELRRQGVFESEEESKTRCGDLPPSVLQAVCARTARAGGNKQTLTVGVRRELVLGRLASLINKFVRRVSLQCGYSEAAANTAGGKIYTFGSYRLGVHGPGSDIDTLVVVPRHVTREHFFGILEEMLREMEGVTEVSVCTRLRVRVSGRSRDGHYREYRKHLCPSSKPRYLASPSTFSLHNSIYRPFRMTLTCRTTTY